MKELGIMFAVSLLLTLGIEGLLALLFHVRRLGWLIVLAANVITNPIVVGLSLVGRSLLPEISHILIELPLEVLATAAEVGAFVFFSREKDIIIPHPISFGIAANVVSWLVGVVLSDWLRTM